MILMVLGGEHGVEGSGELGVTISDEELDRVRVLAEVHPEVSGLLVDPAGDGLAVTPAIRTSRLS